MTRDTIQDIITAWAWLEVKCLDCERTVHIPYGMIPKGLPRDLPCGLAAAFFRCSNCKSKHLVSRQWDIQKASGYATKR